MSTIRLMDNVNLYGISVAPLRDNEIRDLYEEAMLRVAEPNRIPSNRDFQLWLQQSPPSGGIHVEGNYDGDFQQLVQNLEPIMGTYQQFEVIHPTGNTQLLNAILFLIEESSERIEDKPTARLSIVYG